MRTTSEPSRAGVIGGDWAVIAFSQGDSDLEFDDAAYVVPATKRMCIHAPRGHSQCDPFRLSGSLSKVRVVCVEVL